MRGSVLLACCAAVFVLSGCDRLGQDLLAGEEVPELPANNVLEGVVHMVTVDGVKQALLRADTAYLHEDSSTFDLRNVDLTVYDESGRQEAHILSATGVLDTRSNAMVARGDVRVTTREQDRRIRTEELHYDPDRNRIWSEVATTMVEAGATINGTGFTSDARFRNVEITGATARGLRIEI